MRTRIKMCGMKEVADVVTACELGVDGIGLVFCECSSRYVNTETAEALVDACLPFTDVVGLFRNADQQAIENVLKTVDLDLLQFHGEEDETFCNQFGIPYIKAISMNDGEPSQQMMDSFSQSASGLLFDSHGAEQSGGSGVPFDWDSLPQSLDIPVIVAGGLTPDNVQELITSFQPYAVDVSSGIEESKGVKDSDLMYDFVDSVVRADEINRENS